MSLDKRFMTYSLMGIVGLGGCSPDEKSEGRNYEEVENQTYPCTTCNLDYVEKSWAEKCQTWCDTNNSCNLQITSHSLQAQGSKRGTQDEK